MRGIRQISFDAQRKQGTVQGGALISEVVAAAYANDVRVSTGTCNCIGYMGAVLGGGLSRTMGLYGLGIDQLVSLNLVTPAGKSIQVDSTKNSDLWWAMRGAGPNFGIVTSATIHAYPVAAANNTAWTGPLIFTPDKIKAVVAAINNLDLKPKMEIDFYYTTLGPPSYTPAVIAIPFYVGTAAEGRAAFASIFAVGPTSDGTTTLPYNQWNSAGDSFCTKGGLKPAYGVSINRMDPTTWFTIWNEFLTFLKSPGTGNSTVLVECYSTTKAQSIPSSSSAYPFRDLKYHAIVIPEYSDPSLDADANAFAERVRNLWRSTDDVPSNSSYVFLFSLLHPTSYIQLTLFKVHQLCPRRRAIADSIRQQHRKATSSEEGVRPLQALGPMVSTFVVNDYRNQLYGHLTVLFICLYIIILITV